MSDPENVIAGARQEPGAHPYTILVVDDEPAILESIELTLGDDYRVLTALTPRAALDVLEREEIALIIADQVMPQMSGAALLERAVAIQPRAVRMMLTGYADVNAIIHAINDGKIHRYIQKPWEPDQLRLDVKHALEAYRLTAENAQLASALAIANDKLRAENLYLRRQVQRDYAFDQLIGASPSMQRVFDVMQKVAQTDATVLVTGETGTGKDLVARAIHYAGSRKEHRFVAQNCGALPDTLLESELFGHKRGAFTGAHADKKGLFEIADGGTIFLDEIGETEPGMQVRLLRVLQDGEIRPLGSSETRRVDVRIIAATNRDLTRLVEQGRFREDLFYRLRVVEIRLPALRERREDIPALAHHFLDRANAKMRRSLDGFTNAAMDRLCAYHWAGNVRELENEIQRAVALAGDEKTIGAEMLSEHVRGPTPVQGAKGITLPAETDLNRALEALKAAMIQDALKTAGNVTRAAERLGIPRQSLQKMVKRLGLRESADED
jgi:two-component system response regulator HupR/HoxA